ncbi:MAG: hypothetical protein E7393_00710 [Ruminococcaceae bacterium]|nr:hypothetical protein [Oscillospiraceae bacterium]
MIDGSAFAPVRYIMEKLGYNVEKDEDLQVVYIE